MIDDRKVYGFSKQDARSLLESIGGKEPTGSNGRPDGRPRLFRFTLNESLASGTADADILEMDGTDTGLDADVLDPAGVFASLVDVDSAGLCIRQDGRFYVIQAACPE